MNVIRENERLAQHTTLQLGGPAEYFVEARSEKELTEALLFAKERDLSVRLLGGGSNLVVDDEGVPGLVVLLKTKGIVFREEEEATLVTAEAGENWDELCGRVVGENLAGVECLSGIPGSVGATPIQNVGAYGQEVKDTIVSVRTLHRETLEVRDFSSRECEFSYRNSFFKSAAGAPYIVLSVTFRLLRGGAPHLAYAELARAALERTGPLDLTETRALVVELRRRKSMVLDPNDENFRSCGSFFVNALVSPTQLKEISAIAGDAPPAYLQPDGNYKLASAWLIERAGFSKGTSRGSVGQSSRHSLALVAREGATTAELLRFAAEIQAGVRGKFGVDLVREPIFWP